jgi:hypothetical protein
MCCSSARTAFSGLNEFSWVLRNQYWAGGFLRFSTFCCCGIAPAINIPVAAAAVGGWTCSGVRYALRLPAYALCRLPARCVRGSPAPDLGRDACGSMDLCLFYSQEGPSPHYPTHCPLLPSAFTMRPLLTPSHTFLPLLVLVASLHLPFCYQFYQHLWTHIPFSAFTCLRVTAVPGARFIPCYWFCCRGSIFLNVRHFAFVHDACGRSLCAPPLPFYYHLLFPMLPPHHLHFLLFHLVPARAGALYCVNYSVTGFRFGLRC